MDRKNIVFLIGGGIGTLFLLMCLCGSLILLAELTDFDDVIPTPTVTSSGSSHQQPPTYELQVINASSYSICYLYMSRTSSTVWGPDQLGSSILYAGRQFTLYDIEAGVYDIKAETCGGTDIIRHDIVVLEDLVWTLYED